MTPSIWWFYGCLVMFEQAFPQGWMERGAGSDRSRNAAKPCGKFAARHLAGPLHFLPALFVDALYQSEYVAQATFHFFCHIYWIKFVSLLPQLFLRCLTDFITDYYPRRENGTACNAVFYHRFQGLKRISRIKWARSIKSQANPTDECHDIHNSFIIRAIREIRGFYFPI